MNLVGYADAGTAALVAATRKGSCCGGCEEAEARGQKTPCEEAAERAMLVSGVVSELEMAKWFLDNRWTLIGASFAVGATLFAVTSYFVNRNP